MVGRNDLCPCGSGKKYKKCCLAKDEAIEIAKNRVINARKKFECVIEKIIEFSNREEYKDNENKFKIEFGIDNCKLNHRNNIYYLTNYKYSRQTSIMMDYFNKNKKNLDKSELSIVENTLNSYISIYQIKEKDINKILIKDILLRQNLYVEDIDLFGQFDIDDYILARIVTIDNTKIFLDKTVKIDENMKNKIDKNIEARYKDKLKVETKKECLKNNIKYMYQNIHPIDKKKSKQNKIRRQVMARKANKNKIVNKQIDKRLEQKLKQRLEIAKKRREGIETIENQHTQLIIC